MNQQLSLNQVQRQLSAVRKSEIIDLFQQNGNKIMGAREIIGRIKGSTDQEVQGTLQVMCNQGLLKAIKLDRQITEHLEIIRRTHAESNANGKMTRVRYGYALPVKATFTPSVLNPANPIVVEEKPVVSKQAMTEPTQPEPASNEMNLEQAVALASKLGKKLTVKLGDAILTFE